MEHFIPLAVASMVISFISIFLVDYYSPQSPTNSGQDLLSDTPVDTIERVEDSKHLLSNNDTPISSDKKKNLQLEQGLKQSIKDKSIIKIRLFMEKYMPVWVLRTT